MNKLKSLAFFLAGTLVGGPVLAWAAPTATDSLVQLTMVPQLANYITSKLITLNSTGNIVLPVASGKSLLVNGVASSQGLRFPTANYEAVAGAGTTVTDAAQLAATAHTHQITGANGTVGWRFAASVAGQFEILLGTTAGVPKIYANTGGTCNGGSANTACTLTTGILPHLCYSTAVDTWICS